MKNNFFHIFITILNRNNDKYLGIKKQISHYVNHSCEDIVLSPEAQKIFEKTEYGYKKFFRELYFKPIFVELEKTLLSKINKTDHQIFVYLQDEGIWSEMIKLIIKKNNLQHIIFINVQHGFLPLNNFSTFRNLFVRIVNKISIFAFGFPKFGVGPFKGPFDYYLLFDDKYLDQIPKHSKGLICPKLINYSFINQFEKNTSPNNIIHKSVLFIFQHNNLFGLFSKSFDETLNTLVPLIDVLKNKYNYKVFVRKHPGMKHEIFYKKISQAGLDKMVTIDNEDLFFTINRSPFIFGFNSTVLFEADTVQRQPIVIDNESFDLNDWRFPGSYKIINLSNSLENQLNNILSSSNLRKEKKTFELDLPKMLQNDFK